MIERKITKQDLLSICLGCGDCTSALYHDGYGSIYYRVNKLYYVLINKDNKWYTPYTFVTDSSPLEVVCITTIEELKKAMRHDYYLYDV